MNAIVSTTTRNRLPMLALLAANAVSWTGNGITWVAVPWFAYELMNARWRWAVKACGALLR